ncbi:MAG: glycosyltransferase family 4 protein [bacterium]
MKIMMVETLGDGGIAHYAYNLIKALAGHDLEMVLVTNRRYEFEQQATTFRVHGCMASMTGRLLDWLPVLDRETTLPSLVRRLLKVIELPFNTLSAIRLAKREKITLMHLQSVNFVDILIVLGFKHCGLQVVNTIHNVMPWHQELKWWQQKIFTAMYAHCDRIIIHSRSGAEEIQKLYRVAPEKIHVIPHGDYKFFLPDEMLPLAQAKTALGLAPADRTILFFGALRGNKCLGDMLHAMPRIRELAPAVKLMIVGEVSGDYGKYRRIIDELELEPMLYEQLDYIPNEDVAKYFMAADLVAMPYKEITQSGVLQVAYSFGKPVVTTDLDGFKEVVEPGKNGYLVPYGDTQALAERCAELLNDDRLAAIMGAHSRELSDRKYSWSAIAQRTIEEVYHDGQVR